MSVEADRLRIVRAATTPLISELGHFRLEAVEFSDGAEHAAITCGSPTTVERPLVRVQSSCLTGTAFGARLCDCRQQLNASLERIADEGHGVVLYLAQEGRGHGLVEKASQLALIAEGLDTLDAAEVRGFAPDVRDYGQAVALLSTVLGGKRPVRLLTNNPEKIAGLERAGLEVVERVPIETSPTDGNREYLRVKKLRMGHLLTEV